MLYGELSVDFFSSSELLYWNMKHWLRLIARSNFYMISDNPNVSLAIVDCSTYTRRIALRKDHYRKERTDKLAFTLVEFNYFETLAVIFTIPARKKQVIQKNIIHKTPVRQFILAMNTNSIIFGSYTETQQFGFRGIRVPRNEQPIADFDAEDNCRL